ncbi:stage II sporulation protein M [Paenibacillus sp. MSJ-34]|uniref:stage II sporulation protein M n=1 Tax=Paenibacillus sp. MSJ-34 TaxID=2841529 RepID=UPI001C1004FD|nr:stage II sporulation protein M [Paenibacillus sp. MSJ-34]MBU5443805.1 stage II sporulation protein M [Paenibacillus sp. MSJ-34]
MRGYILVSALLFAAGIAFGATPAVSAALESFLAQQVQGLSEIQKMLAEQENTQLATFIFIFLNNSIKAVFVIFLGAVLGIAPVLFLVVNGLLVGFVVQISAAQYSSVWELIVKGLLPHGILEIPAIIIACAYGMRFGILLIQSIGWSLTPKRAEIGDSLGEFMMRSLAVSVWIVVALFVAAVIESTFTMWLMQTVKAS